MPFITSAVRLASVLSSLRELGVLARETHLGVLREALYRNPHFTAVWSAWEPRMLHENPRRVFNAAFHETNEGRKPFWLSRFDSGGATSEGGHCGDPLPGDRYQCALVERSTVIIAPYSSTSAGETVLLATTAAPIVVGERALGAVGVDFALDRLADQVALTENAETKALVNLVAQELHAALVFVDSRKRVVASSDSATGTLRGFTRTELLTGNVVPEELSEGGGDEHDGTNPRQLLKGTAKLNVAHAISPETGTTVFVISRVMVAIDLPRLSVREDEVMRWLAEGKSNDEIGIILSISTHTVKNHLDKIYRKMGVDNRHAAMLAWSRAKAVSGVVPCPWRGWSAGIEII